MLDLSTTTTFDKLFKKLPKTIQRKAASKAEVFRAQPAQRTVFMTVGEAGDLRKRNPTPLLAPRSLTMPWASINKSILMPIPIGPVSAESSLCDQTGYLLHLRLRCEHSLRSRLDSVNLGDGLTQWGYVFCGVNLRLAPPLTMTNSYSRHSRSPLKRGIRFDGVRPMRLGTRASPVRI